MRDNGVLWGSYRKCVLGNDCHLIGGAHTLCFYVYIYGFFKFYEEGIATLGQSLEFAFGRWGPG